MEFIKGLESDAIAGDETVAKPCEAVSKVPAPLPLLYDEYTVRSSESAGHQQEIGLLLWGNVMKDVTYDHKIEGRRAGCGKVPHALTSESDPSGVSAVEATGLGGDVDRQDLRFGEYSCQAGREEAIATAHLEDSRSGRERSQLER